MATTKDLAVLIDREMGKGQGPFLIRICQEARLLPTAKRGGWRSMEQLTPEQLADFVIAIAGTRAVGERNANGARAAIERFASLTFNWKDERGVRTLREDIAYFLGQYRDNLEIGKDYYCSWILFINDSQVPQVEIRLVRLVEDEDDHALNYVNPEIKSEASPVSEAVVIEAQLLFDLGVMLREDTVQDASA